MAGTCDLCGGKTGFLNRFRCQDGAVCKNCYRIVSGNYSDTIARKSLKELKRLYVQNARPLDLGEDGFQVTRRMDPYVLLDETNGKLCLLNNRKLTGRNTRPEILPREKLKGVRLVSEPDLPPERLAELASDRKQSEIIRRLCVRLDLKGGGSREIVIIPTPVRSSSLAFRKGRQTADKVRAALSEL